MKTKFYLLMLLLTASFGQVFGASPTSLTFSTKYNSNTTLGGTEIKLDDNVSVTFTANKGTAPQYYTTGSSVRAYAKNQITISPKNGVTITGITLTFGSSDGSNAITASSGTWTSPSWTGTSTSAVVLTIGGTSGNRRIAGVSVTYSSGSKYTVDYAGGTGATGAAPASHSNLNNGDKITLANNTFSKTGYNFAGWNDGTSTYNAGVQYTVSASKTMTAQWTAKTYTITLNANGHGEADGSATATYDATTLSSVSGVKANTGYSLNGYFTATSGGTKVINANGTLVSNVGGYTDATGKWNKDGACTLYAQYTQSFTITFIDKLQNTAGYTSPTGHTLQVADGATFTFPDALTDGTPTAEQKASGTCEQQHYHFVGWILSTQEGTANADGHANVKAAGSTSGVVSAAATYYAVWAKEE